MKPDSKRIFIVCDTYPPRTWGQERVAQRLARSLADFGLTAEVLTLDYVPGPPGWRTEQEADGVVLTRIRPPDLVLQAEWMARALQDRGPAAAVIAFAVGPYAEVAVRTAKRWGVPSLVCARGRDANQDLFDPTRIPGVLTALTEATRLTAVSQEMARLLRAYRQDDILVWPNVVDQAHFAPRPGKTDLRRQFGLPETALLAGFAGDLRPVKGMAVILEAFHRLRRHRPDAHLALIGGVAPRDQAALDQWGQRHPADAAQLHVMPVVPPDRMPEALGVLDQIWFPSLLEGFCNAVLEAMACGVPVIATPVGGNPEIIRHGETGLLIPVDDADALVTAALRLAGDPDETAAMTARAREALTPYRPERERERWRAVCQEFGLVTA